MLIGSLTTTRSGELLLNLGDRMMPSTAEYYASFTPVQAAKKLAGPNWEELIKLVSELHLIGLDTEPDRELKLVPRCGNYQ
jgi:hypothetical protein